MRAIFGWQLLKYEAHYFNIQVIREKLNFNVDGDFHDFMIFMIVRKSITLVRLSDQSDSGLKTDILYPALLCLFSVRNSLKYKDQSIQDPKMEDCIFLSKKIGTAQVYLTREKYRQM